MIIQKLMLKSRFISIKFFFFTLQPWVSPCTRNPNYRYHFGCKGILSYIVTSNKIYIRLYVLKIIYSEIETKFCQFSNIYQIKVKT